MSSASYFPWSRQHIETMLGKEIFRLVRIQARAQNQFTKEQIEHLHNGKFIGI
jgi:hypothetical protein